MLNEQCDQCKKIHFLRFQGNYDQIEISRMANSLKLGYSPCGSYLALTTNDGKLIVYDAKTGKEQNQFVPSAHLSSSACTCLAWMPNSVKIPTETPSKKYVNLILKILKHLT